MKEYNETNFITGLRFFAVMLVFFAHSSATNLYDEFTILEPLHVIGKFGVDIFFVISGFTIVYQLNQSKLSVSRFIYIRLARISSAYWPLLILVGIYYKYDIGPSLTGWYDLVSDVPLYETLISHFLYLGSLVPKHANSLVGVEWSLNIEVFYYIFFGVLCYFNLVSRVLWLVPILLISLIISISTAYFRHDLGISIEYYLWGPMKYFYMFVLGGLSYFVRRYISLSKYGWKLYLSDLSIIFFVICITCVISLEIYLKSSFLMSLIISVLTFVLISCVDQKSKLSNILNNSIANFIGGVSFSFYLLHYPILKAMEPYYDNYSSIFNIIVVLTTAITCSYIWSVLFENKLYTYLKKLSNGI